MDIVLKSLAAGDAEWLVREHAQAYARSDGFDDSFGPLVAGILAEFEAGHDPSCERGFIAWRGPERVGSVFCVDQGDGTAKLRLFYLVESQRGRGLGQYLLETCMAFAQSAGYRRMQLWTHESHRAACALYSRNGWTLTSSKPVHSFGVDLVEQSWSVDLTKEM